MIRLTKDSGSSFAFDAAKATTWIGVWSWFRRKHPMRFLLTDIEDFLRRRWDDSAGLQRLVDVVADKGWARKGKYARTSV